MAHISFILLDLHMHTYAQQIYLHVSEQEYADKLLHHQPKVDDMAN